MKRCWAFVGLLLLVSAAPLPAGEGKKAEPKTYQIPYRLTDTQHVLVRVKLNGKGPFNFILDTGAPALFIATATADKVGIKPDQGAWGKVERFEIEGGLVIPQAEGRIETPFQLKGINGMGLAGAELHGIIGYNLLARYRIRLDFTRDKMAWTPLDFKPPLPQGLTESGGSAPGGLDAIGSVMSMLGGLMGRKADPVVKLRGFLGAELAEVDGGVEVKAVLADGPAAKAGLKAGDRVSRFQGKAVQARADVLRLAAALAEGQTARFQVTRGGVVQEVEVKLGEGL